MSQKPEPTYQRPAPLPVKAFPPVASPAAPSTSDAPSEWLPHGGAGPSPPSGAGPLPHDGGGVGVPTLQRPKSAGGPQGVPSLNAWYSKKKATESDSRQSTPKSGKDWMEQQSGRDLMEGFYCTPRSTAIGGAVCPATAMRPKSAGPNRPQTARTSRGQFANLPEGPGFGLKQKVRDLEARLAKEIREAKEDVERARQEKIMSGHGLSRSEAEALVAETKREILDSFDKKRSEFAKFWVQQNADNKRFQDQLNETRNGNYENQSKIEHLRRRISDLATEFGVGVEYDDDLRATYTQDHSDWHKYH